MLRCNLAIILAEKNLRITKVSNDTGISRTTLTALCNNNSQGIQFDTLNKLCNYLEVKPNELIQHIPIEITVNHVIVNQTHMFTDEIDESDLKDHCVIEFSVIQNNQTFYYQLKCPAFISKNKYDDIIGITIIVENTNPNRTNPLSFIFELFNQLPRTFLTDIENEISLKTADFLGKSLSEINISISWHFLK